MYNFFFNIKKHSLIRVLFLTICFKFNVGLVAQTNLVPNPSFEQYTNCPDNSTNAKSIISKPDIWYKPDIGGGGYLNACSNDTPALRGGVPYHPLSFGFGYQPTKTGNAYVSIFYFNGTNNYFQTKLFDSLKANKYYYGEYYVNLTNNSSVACNNQSMLFTKNPVYVDTANNAQILPANPQITNYQNDIIADTVNWVKVSGIFKAQGGEQYLTLGNFRDLINDTKRVLFQTFGNGGAYYYADDVTVYALDSFNLKADAGKDTTITLGDSAFIGSYTNGIDSLKWQLQTTGVAIDSTRPGFWVKPLVSTCYVLTQTVNGFTSSDTVCVTVGTVPLKFISFSIFPSLGGVRGGWTTANEINVSHFNIQRSVNGKDFINIGQVVANNKNHNEYSFIDDKLPLLTTDQLTFYYRLQSVDKDGKVSYTQTRTLNLKPQTLNGFSLYPNPAKNVVNVYCASGIKTIVISDYLGKQIYKQIATGTNLRNDVHTINTNQLTKGIYIVQLITTKGEVKNEKLIVE